jgi:hypothetical protein
LVIEDHGTRWILMVLAAFAVSLVLRGIAWRETRRGDQRLEAARRALGLSEPPPPESPPTPPAPQSPPTPPAPPAPQSPPDGPAV